MVTQSIDTFFYWDRWSFSFSIFHPKTCSFFVQKNSKLYIHTKWDPYHKIESSRWKSLTSFCDPKSLSSCDMKEKQKHVFGWKIENEKLHLSQYKKVSIDWVTNWVFYLVIYYMFIYYLIGITTVKGLKIVLKSLQ